MSTTIQASILAVITSAVPTLAQGYGWGHLTPSSSPGFQFQYAMVDDEARQRVILFGAGMWEWDGTTWMQRFPSTIPPGRIRHAMAYDRLRQRVVLFGGFNSSGTLGDTWEWDGNNWMQKAPSLSPAPQLGHAMAYDTAHQRVVMFGVGSGSSLGETWEWDGNNWMQRTPTLSPPNRVGRAMAYDSVRQRLVMVGGDEGNPSTQTWEWDGNNWTHVFPASSPLGRSDFGMAFDAIQSRVVLFGGSGGFGTLGDTWEWDGTNWVQQLTPGPVPRAGHRMAYDSARQRVVMYGGVGSFYLVDTWVLWTPGTPAFATSYGTGCGSPPLGFVPNMTHRPILGQVGWATITSAPTAAAGVAMGWSNTFAFPVVLPFNLAGIGMPGCDLLQSSEIIGLGVAPLTATTLSFSLAIPSLPSLIGSHAYLQAYAFAPGQNALQIIASNGIDWLLGDI